MIGTRRADFDYGNTRLRARKGELLDDAAYESLLGKDLAGLLDMLADTPLAKIDDIEFVRTVAVARITMPFSMVRLSAGRETMSPEMQALCFLAGANSIFVGGKLLTTPNPEEDKDAALFRDLDLRPMIAERRP